MFTSSLRAPGPCRDKSSLENNQTSGDRWGGGGGGGGGGMQGFSKCFK